MSRSSPVAELDRLREENEHLLDSLRAAEEQLQRALELVDFSPVAYLALSEAGTIQTANRAAAALLSPGHPPALLVGRTLRQFLEPTQGVAVSGHLRRCAERSEGAECELQLLGGRPVEARSRRTPDGQRVLQTVLIDLSALRRSEEETRRLAEAEKAARAESQAKDTFIATLSHELRTPLTPVLAAVTALAADEVPESLVSIFDVIRRNVVAETRLIDDLLDVTRIAHAKMQIERRPLDVEDVVKDSVRTLRAEFDAKGIQVDTFFEADRHWASADVTRLGQVFTNLLRNALKFSDEGGRVEIRSWNIPDNERSRLALEVSDSGRGFEPSAAAQLFQPFEQGANLPLRNGGLGLGLAICKGMMDLHQGRITAFSRGPGLGARFIVEIDTVPTEVAAKPAPSATASRTASKAQLRVLLVDDHEDTADLLATFLTDAGYDVTTAYTAKDALAVDLDRIDLVVSDIGLPDVSGLDLMRALRDRSVKGVALSGYGTESDVQASKDAGFSAHLTKPVDFQRLISALREVEATL